MERSYYLENVRKLGVRGRVIAIDRKRDLALVELSKVPEGSQAIELAPESVIPPRTVATRCIARNGSKPIIRCKATMTPARSGRLGGGVRDVWPQVWSSPDSGRP